MVEGWSGCGVEVDYYGESMLKISPSGIVLGDVVACDGGDPGLQMQ